MTQPLLEVRGLSISYGSGRSAWKAVNDIDITVPEGGSIGLIGESGSGKSTVARALLGLQPIASGEVRLDGKNVVGRGNRVTSDVRRVMQLVFQDPYASLNPRMRVEEVLNEALHVRTPRSAKSSAELMSEVGLPRELLWRYPHQLSGGQRQRVAIARALACRPSLLVLDEVTSALDVSVQAGVLNLLRDLRREHGISFLMISHDLAVIRYICDDIVVIYSGRTMEAGPSSDVLTQPAHPYTRSLLAAIPRLHSDEVRVQVAPSRGEISDPRHPPRGCVFHPRCPIAESLGTQTAPCFNVVPKLHQIRGSTSAACHFPLEGSDGTD